jgi:shikimate kinase
MQGSMRPDNVILVGFMGAGKSVCGRRLAERLGRRFVETDDLIVAREGRSIPEIFRRDGEAAFRRLEGEVLDGIAREHGQVIATGGGLPCREARMERLRELGTVVWLSGDLDELVGRARRLGGRPMLEGKSMEDVETLYRAREPYYARADVVIDTTDADPDDVVARLLGALREPRGARVS